MLSWDDELHCRNVVGKRTIWEGGKGGTPSSCLLKIRGEDGGLLAALLHTLIDECVVLMKTDI